MSDTSNTALDAIEEEEEGSALPPDVLKRGLEAPLTVEAILEHFRHWLTDKHVQSQDALRFARDEQRQLAPIVAAVGHLDRAGELVRQHHTLCAQIVTLEAEYNSLEACQLVAAGTYEVDFGDANTLALFGRCMSEAYPEKWCLW